MTTVAAVAALLAFYQRDVGRSLIWLGQTISGKTKASEIAPEKNPEAKTDSSPTSAPSVASTEPATQQSDSTPSCGAGSDSKINKEVIGVKEKQPGTIPPQSVLEQPGAATKSEPWKGVQSGSISAEMSLAERFAHGEGVERNCDQAKVLMRAAANRGSKEARLRLYELESGACE